MDAKEQLRKASELVKACEKIGIGPKQGEDAYAGLEALRHVVQALYPDYTITKCRLI